MVSRLAVALAWLYQGLWCKVLGRCPGHQAIVESVPGLDPRTAALALAGLGWIEMGLAVWVLVPAAVAIATSPGPGTTAVVVVIGAASGGALGALRRGRA